jgi:hypothetical protein
MANRRFEQFSGGLEKGVIKLFAKVTTSTVGIIASQSSLGFKLEKTAGEVGRYTAKLDDKYIGLLGCSVIVEGAADAAYPVAKGVTAILRNVATQTKTLDIQFTQANTLADSEIADGASFYVELTLKNSSV